VTNKTVINDGKDTTHYSRKSPQYLLTKEDLNDDPLGSQNDNESIIQFPQTLEEIVDKHLLLYAYIEHNDLMTSQIRMEM